MNRYFVQLLLIISLAYSSCDDTETPQTEDIEVTLKTSDTLKIPRLQGIKPALKLTPEATDAVKNWTFYKDLSLEVDSLNFSTMGELRYRVERLHKLFQEKENAEEAEAPTIPKSVQTKAIQSRVLAIQTQLNILRNNSNRNTPDIDQVAMAIVKVKNGLQHLNLQLNERFSISIQELLEEIQNEEEDTPNNSTTPGPRGKPEIQ